MAEPYGTFFPENVGSMFAPRPSGQPEVLSKLGNLYDTTSPQQMFTPPVTDSPFPQPQVNLAPPPTEQPLPPPINQVGPNYIPTGPDLTTPVKPEVDPYDEIISRYKPETRAQEAYWNLINNMPKRVEPGMGRRILAGLSTLGKGGLAQAENVKYGDYNAAMADTQTKAKMLENLANQERQSNVNERQMVNTILQNKIQQEKVDTANRAQEEKARQNQRMYTLEQTKQANPNWIAKEDVGGEIIFFNPNNPSQVKRTGIRGKDIPEEYKIMLLNAMASNRDRLNFMDKQEFEDQQHRNRMLELQKKAELGDDAAIKELEKLRGRYNRANALFNGDDENKKFISMGDPSANTFKVAMPDDVWGEGNWFGWGVDKRKAYAQRFISINQHIYGDDYKPEQSLINTAETGFSDRGAKVAKPPTPVVAKPGTNKPVKAADVKAAGMGGAAPAITPPKVIPPRPASLPATSFRARLIKDLVIGGKIVGKKGEEGWVSPEVFAMGNHERIQ